MFWVVSLWFCSPSKKPLMVIHHQDTHPHSQATAATLVYHGWIIFEYTNTGLLHRLSNAELGFTRNTMGAFLNNTQITEPVLSIDHTAGFQEVSSMQVSSGFPELINYKDTYRGKACFNFGVKLNICAFWASDQSSSSQVQSEETYFLFCFYFMM